MKPSGNTHQTSMFDVQNHDGNTTVAPSRRSDPATSKAAAERVNVSANERLFLAAVAKQSFPSSSYAIAAQSIAYTVDEPKKQTDKRRETVRKRASGLFDKGLIRIVEQSYCDYHEADCNKYEITPKGKEEHDHN